MQAKISLDGVDLGIREIELDLTTIDDVPPLLDAKIAEQTLTLNVYFYQLLWLAHAIEPRNPKKAKHIRTLAQPHNPLRLLGLMA